MLPISARDAALHRTSLAKSRVLQCAVLILLCPRKASKFRAN